MRSFKIITNKRGNWKLAYLDNNSKKTKKIARSTVYSFFTDFTIKYLQILE